MEVGFHELCDDVDISVACLCFWFEDVDQADDVVVLEELLMG
jgi:hypothetical protein